MSVKLVDENPSVDLSVSTMTDFANALKFADLHKGKILYDPQLSQWYAYDGKRFAPVPDAVIRGRFVEEFVLSLTEAAILEPDPEAQAASLKWAQECQTFNKLKALVDRAAACSELFIKSGDLDADPYALNVQNGVIDLRTGTLRDRMGADRFTVVAPTEFDPDATCPMFERFVESSIPDPEVRGFMRRSLGYFLTGLVSEQHIWFLIGRGGTGKSSLFLTMAKVLGVGEHVHFTDPNFLSERSSEAHPTELVSLRGKRLVICPELPARKAFNEARIKTLTGGDMITAHKMAKDEVTFSPTHKLVAYANNRPRLYTGGDSLLRRLLLVPFDTAVSAEQRDKDLVTKIVANESPGVLAWLVRACLEWQRDGLNPPTSMQASAEDYMKEENSFSDFFQEKTEFDGKSVTEFFRIYSEYASWCKDYSTAPESQSRLKQELVTRGATRVRNPHKRQRLAYSGIVLFP